MDRKKKKRDKGKNIQWGRKKKEWGKWIGNEKSEVEGRKKKQARSKGET